MKDYSKKARTKHEMYDMPSVSILNYKRRNIDHFRQTADKPPIPQETRRIFPKKYANPLNGMVQAQEQLEGDNNLDEDQVGNDAEVILNMVVPLMPNKDKKLKKVIQMDPRIKVFKDDEQTESTKLTKNLNDKFELKSNYVAYQPSTDVREMRLEKVYQKGKQHEAM